MESQVWLTCDGPLDTERSDEDVDDNYDEDEGRGHVLHDVQLVVHALIVQVPLHWLEEI